MNLKLTTVILTLLIAAVWLVNCADVPSSGPTPPEFNAQYRFINAAEDLGDVGVSVDGSSVGTAAYGGAIAHQTFPAGSRVVALNSGDSQTIAMDTDQRGSIVFLPLVGDTRRFLRLSERRTFDSPTTPTAMFRGVHASPDAGDIEITVAGADTTITETGSYGDVSPYASVPAGDYTMTVTTAAGDTLVGTFSFSNMRHTGILMGSSAAGTLSLVGFDDN
ncbi:MAG: DUF4397 domain-containing protein [bacterium]